MPDSILKSVRSSILSLPVYQAGRAPKVSKSGVRIKLSSNENRFGSSPRVMDVLRKVNEQDLFLYPDPYARDLRKALVSYWQNFGIQLQEDAFLFGDGSGEVLDLIFATFFRENDILVIPEKSFSLYKLLSLSKGAHVIEVQRKDYKVDLQAIAQSVRDNNARMVVFSNPDNPTSTFCDSDEIRSFLNAIPKDTLVLIDEAYIHFEGMESSAIQFLKEYPNLILTYTFSKAYALASMRVGYAVMHPKLSEVVHRLRLPFNLGYLPQVAALAALGDEVYLKDMLTRLIEERKRVFEFFLKQGYEVLKPHGNFIFVHLSEKQKALPEFLENNGVSVRNLLSFGFESSDIRITIGTESDNRVLFDLLEAYSHSTEEC